MKLIQITHQKRIFLREFQMSIQWTLGDLRGKALENFGGYEKCSIIFKFLGDDTKTKNVKNYFFLWGWVRKIIFTSTGADWPVGQSGNARAAPLKIIYIAPLVIINKRNPESPGKSCKIKYNARCTCPANISTLD